MFSIDRQTVNLEWLNRLTIALCPPVCVLCQQPGQLEAGSPLDLCSACEAELPTCAQAVQRLPARPAASGAAVQFIPWRFEPPVDALIRDLKFHSQTHNARVLGTLLARAVAAHDVERPQGLVPMPLHDARLAERGYNQASEIAHYAGQALGLPVKRNLLTRTRATAEQSHLGAIERAANVAGAFVCTPQRRSDALPLHVALLDDVVTTGSTAQEAARRLRNAGVARVDIWAIARA